LGLRLFNSFFYLFTSKPNSSISNFNDHLLEFVSDSLAFLLFSTDDKPFPFKPESSVKSEDDVESEIIDVTVEDDNETSEVEASDVENQETKD